jgi:hypothetical protein
MKPSSLPQQVTIRYAGHLLRKGKNNQFTLLKLSQQESIQDDVILGNYYVATVYRRCHKVETAVGITPYQAVQRALSKHGVTFRRIS